VITKYIKILEDSDVVQVKKSGHEQLAYPNSKFLKTVSYCLNFHKNFWDNILKGLTDYLDIK
jgi:ribosomal protein S6